MYNMDFSFLNHTVSIKMLILIGFVYSILIMSTVNSCCNNKGIMKSLEGFMGGNNSLKPLSPALVKEGFTGANTNNGESSKYSLAHSNVVDTSKWGSPTLTVSGNNVPAAAQAIINRPNQSFPLPEGQLSLFDNMPFSPECCPNTYSSSMGCACMNSNTYNYLITRGGNNVPYSEY